MYARNPDATLHYDAYDDTQFEVVLMCGLPAAGKDTWVRQHAGHLPAIALDAIREELDIAPTEHPGRVVLAAKRRARELLQQRQPFVWNATKHHQAAAPPAGRFLHRLQGARADRVRRRAARGDPAAQPRQARPRARR